MKLFIREHLLLIIVQCIQMGAFMGILLLARFDDIAIIAYCIFINFFILLLYLIYMYWTRKNFYKKLVKFLGLFCVIKAEIKERKHKLNLKG